MNDSLGALLAIAVLWVILRFAFGGSASSGGSGHGTGPSLDAARASQVPQNMVDAVKTLFPHVPEASIRYDLQRSGSAEATCDRILNEGGLPTPPAGFFGTASPNHAASTSTATAPVTWTARHASRGIDGRAQALASTSTLVASGSGSRATLISRFGLDGTEAGDKGASDAAPQGWAVSSEERAKRLEERKRRMIIEARLKLLEKQKAASAQS
ncbi:hypothetical protein ACQY0O_003250 [Thecaphora frezii]